MLAVFDRRQQRFSFAGLPEWVESGAISLPAAHKFPGPIRLDSTPYFRGILDSIADDEVRRVSLMCATQTGKSLTANELILFVMAERPCQMMLLLPTEIIRGRWVADRLEPMLKTCPTAEEAQIQRKGKVNDHTRQFMGGSLTLAHAGSISNLGESTVSLVIADEVDDYIATAAGHPFTLIQDRLGSFGDKGKLLALSKPTILGKSMIYRQYLAGSASVWMCPCPACGESFDLLWDTVDREKAAIICPNKTCRRAIPEDERMEVVRAGKWVDANENATHKSFHLSHLHSPLSSLELLIEQYRQAELEGSLVTFYNSKLAQPYQHQAELAMPLTALQTIRDNTPPGGPEWPGMRYTAGLDVQVDSIHLSLAGWTKDSLWFADHRVLSGNIEFPEVWAGVPGVLDEWEAKWGLEGAFIDSGYQTPVVHNYVNMWRRVGYEIYPCKGMNNELAPIVDPQPGRTGEGSNRHSYFKVGPTACKDFLLGYVFPTPGHLAIAPHIGNETLEQMVSETRQETRRYGQPVFRYVKVRARNEALDNLDNALACYRWMYPVDIILRPE